MDIDFIGGVIVQPNVRERQVAPVVADLSARGRVGVGSLSSKSQGLGLGGAVGTDAGMTAGRRSAITMSDHAGTYANGQGRAWRPPE